MDDIKNYDIEHNTILGSGGFGQVVLGTYKPTGQKVAIKKINKKSLPDEYHRQFFRNEIKMLQQLSRKGDCNKYTVCYYGMDETYPNDPNSGVYYVIMEYIEGFSLKDFVEYYSPPTKSPMTNSMALIYILLKLAEALTFIHSQGIIHRDLKLDNAICTTKICDKDIKLIDFGFSCFHLERGTGYDCTHSYMGTKNYIAPEVLTLEIKDFEKIDIYSLGVMFYNITTRKSPFTPSTKIDTGNNVLDELIYFMTNFEAKRRPYAYEVVKYIYEYLIPDLEDNKNYIRIAEGEPERQYIGDDKWDGYVWLSDK